MVWTCVDIMAGIREVNRCLGATECIKEMVVVKTCSKLRRLRRKSPSFRFNNVEGRTTHGLWVGLWALLKHVWCLGNTHTWESHSQGRYAVWSNLVRLLHCRPLATQWHLVLYHTHLWVCQRPWQCAHGGRRWGVWLSPSDLKKKNPPSPKISGAHTWFLLQFYAFEL